ncbi:MAG: ADP-ribosylglycohydrolase family protein, partial [Gemmatimonadaceae bacterium]
MRVAIDCHMVGQPHPGDAGNARYHAALAAAIVAEQFKDAVFAAVNPGGASDAIGAIAGAVAGARFGSAGIPQRLIDGLQGRIYV